MVTQDTDFWRRMGKTAPGLFDLGSDLYGMRSSRREADSNLRAAQGPAFDQAMAASQNALTGAGSLDPRTAAAEQLAAQQKLLSGKDAADEQALIRMLHSQGMLGSASFNPGVEGITPNGTAMNPQMAAFYAARGGRDAKMAADSLAAGEAQIDRQIGRSSNLQNQALGRQQGMLNAAKTVNKPSRTEQTMNLLKGASGVLKNPGALKSITGMLGQGYDWLGSTTGLWNNGPELLNNMDWLS